MTKSGRRGEEKPKIPESLDMGKSTSKAPRSQKSRLGAITHTNHIIATIILE